MDGVFHGLPTDVVPHYCHVPPFPGAEHPVGRHRRTALEQNDVVVCSKLLWMVKLIGGQCTRHYCRWVGRRGLHLRRCHIGAEDDGVAGLSDSVSTEQHGVCTVPSLTT